MEERKEDKEEHTWPEEPCSSFWEEVERRMGKNRRSKDKRCKHVKMQITKYMPARRPVLYRVPV